MANKITLDVELKSQIKNAQQLHSEVSKNTSFNSTGIKNSLKTLSKFENVTELTEKEFKSLNSALQKVTNSLFKFLSDNGKLSTSAVELKKKIDEQLTAIKNIKNNQNKNEKESQERKTTLTEKLGGKTIHAIDSKGSLTKEELSEEEIATKLAKGEKVGFQDDKGKIQEVTSDSELGKAALAYNETIEKAQKLATSFENATNILLEHSSKLRDQVAQDLGIKIDKPPIMEPIAESKEEQTEVKTLIDQLKESLAQLLEATRGLNLTEQQKQAVDRHEKGANFALQIDDWKDFQVHFNAILKTFKSAAAASDELSASIKSLTDKQGNLNQEINDLTTEKQNLENKLTKDDSGKTVLTKSAAEAFAKTSKDAEKVLLKDDSQATRDEIIKIQEALNTYLQQTGKELSKLTKEDVAKINGMSGVDVKDRNSLFAVNRYTKAENAEPSRISKTISSTDQQIESKTTELNNIKTRLDELNTAAKSGADSINALYIKINELANAANKAITTELNKDSAQQVDKTPVTPTTSADDIKPIKEQTSGLAKAFKQFTIYNIALRAVKRALREAISTVKELDKELTEQAMVTGLTRDQTYKLVKSYQDLAAETGATTKEIAGVATEYMKQGKSINDALILTEAAVAAAKVARVSTADSVNYLTTALNGFQLAASDAMLVSDKFAAVAAASATDYDELATALSKVASQANLAGMSIDYTTALLTKGLETTREAPETMGTALKTIIARMRELGDYGETLEGDTDINNVEQQLAYIGIALRNTNGELRSTEDVLNELGMAWDDLSKNQQAAVAKALAGTRQQSRLIAMMSDYDRVLELQEISQRSAGATSAQAGVYLEGMEAALNKITVAWEKIVTALTDADWIIGLLEGAGNLLDNIGAALEDETASMFILIPLGTAIVTMLTHKYETQKRINRAAIQEEKAKRDQLILEKQQTLTMKRSLLAGLKKLKTDKAITKQAAMQALLNKDKTDDAMAQATLAQITKDEVIDRGKLDAEILALEKETRAEELEIRDLKYQQAQSSLQELQNQSGILSIFGNLLGILTPVFMMMQLINGAQVLFLKLKKKEAGASSAAAEAAGKETEVKTANMFAGIVGAFSKTGPQGVVAGILLAIALATALGVTIAASLGAFNTKDSSDDSAASINKLSNEIYKLEEKANAINKVTTSFEDLDNKVIKTKKDIEEMNELLNSAVDNLSSETYDSKKDAKKAGAIWYGKGVSEQDYYKTLYDKDKIRFLQSEEKRARDLADKYRQKQLDEFNILSGFAKAAMLDENTSNAEFRKAQSALYAINNNNLYEYIDKLKETTNITDEVATATEELTENLLAELDTYKALNLANKGESGIATIVDKIKDLDTEINGDNISVAKILTSDDYGITQKAAAFKELATQFGNASDEYKLLASAYAEYETFAQMGEDTLKMIDYLEISIDEINQLNDAYDTLVEKGLKMSQQEYKNLITKDGGILDILASTGGDIASTIEIVFGAALSNAEDYTKTYQALVKTFSDMLGQGSLNMGQHITKLQNQINSFYEKASEWSSLSEAEKTEFMADNAKLFEENPELLRYLETNNWTEIANALSKSETLRDDIDQKLKYIETELEIQKALGDEADQNYTKWLLDRKAELLDSTNLFRADLQLLIEQQQQQLDIYRDYLEKQQEQLEESLEKRKEAYEDYFEAINQQQEDEDYQEQSDLLVANLSKLASSTDAAANKQRAELEQQLEDLEKERQQTLRDRAQEAVIENLGREVEEINDKFDKLLDNEQLLLEAMRGDMTLSGTDDFLGKILATAREGGMTDLQLEDFTNQLSTAFGSVMDISNIGDIMETIQNNATINIGNQTFDLDTEDGDVVWQTLLAMLTKYGYGR